MFKNATVRSGFFIAMTTHHSQQDQPSPLSLRIKQNQAELATVRTFSKPPNAVCVRSTVSDGLVAQSAEQRIENVG
jgi:hypothetical protein